MCRKDTHASAIDMTSYALSYQGRGDGGKMEFGINGVSLGHSDSVNAWASVPYSQLCDTDHVMHERTSIPEKVRLTCAWIC